MHVYGNLLYSVPVCGMFNHSGKDNTWESVEVLWHSTHAADGRWQIAGHIHHLT